MLFNSAVFLIFAVIFFLGWPLLRSGARRRWIFLIAASAVFYGWWDLRFLLLILASGLLDFAVGLGMERFPRRRRALLLASIVGNVGSLATFKYLGFFTANLNAALAGLGFDAAIPAVQLTLPVGISFYTFQSMSYTIDIYRGQIRPTHSVLHFFAYLAMFPQLVAGPIVRARDLLPQLEHAGPTTATQRWEGIKLLTHGYFKKVVIADNLAPAVNAAFGSATSGESALFWWVVVSMFAFQIYCDFSGYSDIARGLARWMGYDFPRNFDHPYVSSSIREFWTRWHISLSTWFRDYVYIPLGGNRLGAALGHRNMWATMVVSGLWHGAAWTFLAWGVLHALYFSIERLTGWPDRLKQLPGGRHLATLLVVLQVWVAWVVFRAENIGQAADILARMFGTGFALDPVLAIGAAPLIALGVGIAREAYFYFGLDKGRFARSRLGIALEPVGIAVLIAACIFLRGKGNDFIYFQF